MAFLLQVGNIIPEESLRPNQGATMKGQVHKRPISNEPSLWFNKLISKMESIPDGLILDIACGYGRNGALLLSLGRRVHFIDINQEALDYIAELSGGDARSALGDLELALSLADKIDKDVVVMDDLQFTYLELNKFKRTDMKFGDELTKWVDFLINPNDLDKNTKEDKDIKKALKAFDYIISNTEEKLII